MATSIKNPPRIAVILGFSGLVPFGAAIALVTLGSADMRPVVLEGFLIYAAVILSFLGGIRWGAASTVSAIPARELTFSVLPSLWAAFFLWWPPEDFAVWGLMTGFILLGWADWVYPGLNVPAWMRPLRVRLTVAVVACHLVVFAVV